jgi:hypothetical protein
MQQLLRTIIYFFDILIVSFYSNRNTFLTEFFTDDITTNIANNSLLAVDLGQLTIRSDAGDKTFAELLSELNK